LGIFELASHRYSDRKDELASAEQTDAQRKHDEEMLRLQGDLEASRAQIAQADERAALAEQKTAEINLILAKIREWRNISVDDQAKMATELRAFSGTKFDAAVSSAAPEIANLLDTIESALANATWGQIPWTHESIMYTRQNKPEVGLRGAQGVSVVVDPQNERVLSAAGEELARLLNAARVPARFLVAPTMEADNRDAIHVVLGEKTFPVVP